MANPTTILAKILNVVSLTELSIRDVNSNVKKIAEAAEQNTNVSAAVGGMTGGQTSTESNAVIVKKLDEIITILKGSKESSGGSKIEMSTLSKAIGAISLNLIRFAFVPPKVKNNFLSFLKNIVEIFEETDPGKVTKGAKAFEIIANSLGIFARGLAVVALATIATLPFQPIMLITIFAYQKLFEYMGQHDRDIRKGARSFETMSKGLLIFAGGIAIMAITFASIGALMGGVGILAAVGGIALSLVAFAGAMMLFSLPPVERGVKSMKDVGKGFLYLAGGIAILGLTFAIIGELMGGKGIAQGVLGMIAAVAGIGLVFALLGIVSPLVKRGTDALKDVGIGFLFLAGGIAIMAIGFGFAAKIFDVSPAGLGVAIGISILGISLAFMIMGAAKQNIAYGALSMALMGLSLVVVSWGVKKMFDAIEGKSWEDMAQLGVTLVGLGVVFAAAGIPIVAGFIMLGALAFAAVGGALYLLAKGIEQWTSLGAFEFDGEKFKSLMTDLRDGFLVLTDESGGTSSGFTGMIGSFFTAGKLLAGVTAAIGIGFALSAIAKGVGAWAQLDATHEITGFDKNGMPVYGPKTFNVSQAVKNIQLALGKPDGNSEGFNIIQPFIDLSNTANLGKTTSLTSLMIGADLGESPFSRGVSIAGNIGRVLSKIAEGVATWGRLDAIPVITGYDAKGNPTYGKTVSMSAAIKNVQMALGKPEGGEGFNILQPFIDLSNTANLSKSTSLLSLLVGADFGESPFGRGVSIAGRIGNVLSSIASGIGAWGKVSNVPRVTGFDKNGNPILDYANGTNLKDSVKNIKSMLSLEDQGSVFNIFNQLGEELALYDFAESLKSIIDPFNFTGTIEHPFVKGVNAAMSLGTVLSLMAQGMGQFANMQNVSVLTGYDKNGKPTYDVKTVNVKQVGENIANSITVIASALAKAGLDEDEMEDAIDGLEGMGDLLSGLGMAMNTFANLENIPLIKSYDPKTGKPIYYNRGEKVESFSILGQTYKVDRSFVNVSQVAQNIATALKVIGGAIADEGGIIETYKRKKAMDSFDGVGGLLTGLAKAFDTFANIEAIKIIEGTNPDGSPRYSTKTISISKIGENIGLAITSIANAFEVIGGKSDIEDVLETAGDAIDYIIKPLKSLGGFFTSLSDSFMKEGGKPIDIYFTAKYFTEGFDMIISTLTKNTPIMNALNTGVLMNVLSGVDFFSKTLITLAEKNLDYASIGLGFSTSLTSILDAVNKRQMNPANVSIFSKFTMDLIKLASIQDPFAKFVNSFDKMSTSMGTFANNFLKLSPTSLLAYTDFTKSLTNFVKIDPSEFQAKLDLVSKAFGVKEDNKTPADDLVNSEPGKILNNAAKPKEELTKNAEAAKGLDKGTIQLLAKFDILISKIDSLTSTVDNGISVDNWPAALNKQ